MRVLVVVVVMAAAMAMVMVMVVVVVVMVADDLECKVTWLHACAPYTQSSTDSQNTHLFTPRTHGHTWHAHTCSCLCTYG